MGHLHRLIVFDLDGTLIDSRRDLADSANALITERGGRTLTEEAIVRMVGEGAAVLVRRALTAAGLPVDDTSLPRFLELYDDRLLRTTRAYPGILDALRTLSSSATVAVLTNKPLGPTERLLEALGLREFIATAIGGDGPFPRKPDPSALRHLIAIHAASRGTTALVGDSRIDLETARAAGTRVCLARYGFGFEDLASTTLGRDETIVDDPRHIPAALRRLLDTDDDWG